MVDFGGWDMPVQYSGILEEHHAVRRAVGLFDVSHMGEIDIQGPQAFDLVNLIATSAVSKLVDGQAQYAGLLYSHGGFVDDILIYRVNAQHYFLCVNASNQEKDFEHIAAQNRFDCTVEFSSPRYAQLAIQGPKAAATLQKLTATELAPIKYYRFRDGAVDGVPARLARTGYTGEDCFEVFFEPTEAERLWNRIMEAGAEFGIKPCGLGARNTLRLEAGMALYGQDMDESATPYEAGLAWTVALDAGRDFTGRAALEAQKAAGAARQMIGLVLDEKGVLRHGQAVFTAAGEGEILSGTFSPTLGKAIALARVPAGTTGAVEVDIRGKRLPVRVVKYPFVRDGAAQPGVLA